MGKVADSLKTKGYAVFPGGNSTEMRKALRTINQAFTEQGIEPQNAKLDYDTTYFPDLACHENLLRLYTHGNLSTLVEEFLDVPLTPSSAQIALRFPGPEKPLQPHIDGSYMQEWQPHFSLLAVAFLSDVGEEDGPTMVWPGSHIEIADHVKLFGGQSIIQGKYPSSIIDKKPEPLLAKARDVALIHPLLVHSTSAVRGPNIRYTVFFRVRVAAQDSIGVEFLSNPWLGWI